MVEIALKYLLAKKEVKNFMKVLLSFQFNLNNSSIASTNQKLNNIIYGFWFNKFFNLVIHNVKVNFPTNIERKKLKQSI